LFTNEQKVDLNLYMAKGSNMFYALNDANIVLNAAANYIDLPGCQTYIEKSVAM